MTIKLICVDADDTLWHNERHYNAARERFRNLLSGSGDVDASLEAVERANFETYGFGAKGFALSLVEAAALTAGTKLTGGLIVEILQIGKDLLMHPVELLDGVEDALDALAMRAPLVLVTKGELAHQESKLVRSGLAGRFSSVEIVSDKSADTFRQVFERHGVLPGQAVVVGDSVRSDVLPALEAGAYAGYIPHPLAWDFERRAEPVGESRYQRIESIGAVASWIDLIAQRS
jgi:putative hydrolase of the HAD superfamily